MQAKRLAKQLKVSRHNMAPVEHRPEVKGRRGLQWHWQANCRLHIVAAFTLRNGHNPTRMAVKAILSRQKQQALRWRDRPFAVTEPHQCALRCHWLKILLPPSGQ